MFDKQTLNSLYQNLFKKSRKSTFFSLPNLTKEEDYSINNFFENIGFIENVWHILNSTIDKYNTIIY